MWLTEGLSHEKMPLTMTLRHKDAKTQSFKKLRFSSFLGDLVANDKFF